MFNAVPPGHSSWIYPLDQEKKGQGQGHDDDQVFQAESFMQRDKSIANLQQILQAGG